MPALAAWLLSFLSPCAGDWSGEAELGDARPERADELLSAT